MMEFPERMLIAMLTSYLSDKHNRLLATSNILRNVTDYGSVIHRHPISAVQTTEVPVHPAS